MDVNSITSSRPLAGDYAPAVANRSASGAAGASLVADTSLSPANISGDAAATPGAGAALAVPDLKSAIEAGSKALQGINQALEFQLDASSKQSVVKVVDTQTNEVIRQIPSEQFLQMAQQIDAFQAHLISDKA